LRHKNTKKRESNRIVIGNMLLPLHAYLWWLRMHGTFKAEKHKSASKDVL